MSKKEKLVDVLFMPEGYTRAKKLLTPSLWRELPDVNAANEDGYTPLMYAAQWGFEDIVTLLLNQKAKVDLSTKDGRTALHMAAFNGYDKICSKLLEAGAHINVYTLHSSESPLMCAVKANQLDTVRLLLKAGADVNAPQIFDWTPLLYSLKDGNKKMVQTLLQYGADPNNAGKWQEMYLSWIVRKDDTEMLKLFIKYGINIKKELNALIDTAQKHNCSQVVKYLRQVEEDIRNEPIRRIMEQVNKIVQVSPENLKSTLRTKPELIENILMLNGEVTLFEQVSYEQQRILYPILRQQVAVKVRQKIENIMREKRMKEREV